MSQLKDDVLADLSRTANIAQFFSVRAESPNAIRHICINGVDRDVLPIEDGIRQLLSASLDGKVNVRTFTHKHSKGGAFLMGLTNAGEILSAIDRFTKSGVSVIVNESIDIHDGGISGVVLGETIEFAPGDTPRCVEKPGVCRLPRELGAEMIRIVYGVSVPEFSDSERVEFSIHPRRRGVKHSQCIIWEVDRHFRSESKNNVTIRWPNRFSEHIGDKTFGLLVAFLLGESVPTCAVVSRRVRPFTFGSSTGTNEYWSRTAPGLQLPGKLPTVFGHQDVFTLLESVGEEHKDALAAVLVQESVDAKYSGGAAFRASGEAIIEGVFGNGEKFMLGEASPVRLPNSILLDVNVALQQLKNYLGDVRIEWVHDGVKPWIVQLHIGAISGDPVCIFEGTADRWIEFDTRLGLDKLREVIDDARLSGIGIRLVGDVGITSHFGDLLRSNKIPSVLAKDPSA